MEDVCSVKINFSKEQRRYLCSSDLWPEYVGLGVTREIALKEFDRAVRIHNEVIEEMRAEGLI